MGTDPPSKWDDFACNRPKSWIDRAATGSQRKTTVFEFERRLTVEGLLSRDTPISKGDHLLNSLTPVAQEASQMISKNLLRQD
jgi:hypothetical protein